MFDLGECFEANEYYLSKLTSLDRRISSLNLDNSQLLKRIQEIISGIYVIFDSLDKTVSPKFHALSKEISKGKDTNLLILLDQPGIRKFKKDFRREHHNKDL